MFVNIRCEERVSLVPLIHKSCNVDPPRNKNKNKKDIIFAILTSGSVFCKQWRSQEIHSRRALFNHNLRKKIPIKDNKININLLNKE